MMMTCDSTIHLVTSPAPLFLESIALLRFGCPIMEKKPEDLQREFDVAIVGAGPAGLSAGIWLARFLHDVVIIDSGDPRNWEAQEVHGFLGFERVRPAELRGRGRQSCREYGATLLDAHIERAYRHGPQRFELLTDDDRTIQARRLLLTMGIHDDWPDIPGLDRCYGTTVHTCPNCDGYESQQTSTAVIGDGPKAISVALALTTWTDQITICTHGAPPRFDEATCETLERLQIEVITKPIELLEEDHRQLQSIHFADDHTLECQHLFIAMGQHARDHIGAQVGCNRDEYGFITIDAHHHTSVWNVFAAGDITPGAQLAIRAAAGGAEAALSIHHSLIPTERRVHRKC